MSEAFSTVWADIQSRLEPGAVIDTWSILGRAHKSFRIAEVSSNSVIVTGADIKGCRAVPKSNFEYLHDHWREYCDRELTRKTVTEWCRHFTYVACILHWRRQISK